MAKFLIVLGLTALLVLVTADEHHNVLHLENHCPFPIWPATSGSFLEPGLKLEPHSLPHSVVVRPDGWQGLLWAKTGCNETIGWRCETGGCPDGQHCYPAPVTRAYFWFHSNISSATIDITDYEVQLADGYNVQVQIVPFKNIGAGCRQVGCITDVNGLCPAELAVMKKGKVIACQSPCAVFKDNFWCGRGEYLYKVPVSEWHPKYKATFFGACPTAGNYYGSHLNGFRDGYSTKRVTCASENKHRAEFTVRFC